MKLIKVIIIGLIAQFALLSLVSGEEVSNRVAVVVNKYLAPEIEENLDIYLEDLRNEGYEPVLRLWDLEGEPAPQTLKAFLKGLYKDKENGSLQGAVLIGDLPVPWMELDPILHEKSSDELYAITDKYIAEMYYMDLIGQKWTDADKDYKFDEPDYQSSWDYLLQLTEPVMPKVLAQYLIQEKLYPKPEIWTSRITTSTLEGLLDSKEYEIVNSYLKKNHAYRTGKVIFNRHNLIYMNLLTIPEILGVYVSDFRNLENILSKNATLRSKTPGSEPIDNFFKMLDGINFQMVCWFMHGEKDKVLIRNETMSSTFLANRNANISTAFVFANSCWIGHYEAPGYFAGVYMFKKNHYVLSMVTNTRPTIINIIGSIQPDIIDQFQSNSNLGLAFMHSIKDKMHPLEYTIFQLMLPEPVLPKIILEPVKYKRLDYRTSANAQYILGDGTLKLQSAELIGNEENSPQAYLKKKIDQKEKDEGKEEL